MTNHEYERVAARYVERRRPDPRIAAAIRSALGDAASVVNVGAGTGSYEPPERRVVAVEPTPGMIRRRAESAAPAVRARAEALPFPDASFEAALAVLTIHHWSDWRAGLRELMRVSRREIVLLTWDPESAGFWLGEYLPLLLEEDRRRFPSLPSLRDVLGDVGVTPVRIAHDCTDGFLGAYWRRPAAYLEPDVRAAISSLSTGASDALLGRLADDLATGAWARKHGAVLEQEELDLGYRLVVAWSDRRP
jgi:SAM-dependent methyltransferase